MNTVKLTAAEAVVRFLDNQFIEYDGELIKFVEGFFTLFGHGCVLGLGHALAQKNHALKVFQGKNEQGMAHAAMSFAKQHNRKKIIACTSSITPGRGQYDYRGGDGNGKQYSAAAFPRRHFCLQAARPRVAAIGAAARFDPDHQ